jgi:hypothetical protein
MRAIHCLCVVGGIPITLVKDDSIGRSKIDAEAACACAEKEAENVVAKVYPSDEMSLGCMRNVPLLPVDDHVSPIFEARISIQPQVLVLPKDHVLLHQIDHPGHLEVNETTMTFALQLHEKGVEHCEFTRVEDESLGLRDVHLSGG